MQETTEIRCGFAKPWLIFCRWMVKFQPLRGQFVRLLICPHRLFRGEPDSERYRHMTEKQLSAKTSRQLRLLRDHGLIRKLPRQKRCFATHKGRELTTALDALLAASTKQLMDIAA
jgi:hypothetical protein